MTYRYRYQQRSAARSMGGIGGSFAPPTKMGAQTDPALLQILQQLIANGAMSGQPKATGTRPPNVPPDAQPFSSAPGVTGWAYADGTKHFFDDTGKEIIDPNGPAAATPAGTATSKVGQKVTGKDSTGATISGTITEDVNGVVKVKWDDGVEVQYGADGKPIAPPGGTSGAASTAAAAAGTPGGGPALPAGATAIGTTADGKTVVRMANGAVGLLNPDGTVANVGAAAPAAGGTGANAGIKGLPATSTEPGVTYTGPTSDLIGTPGFAGTGGGGTGPSIDAGPGGDAINVDPGAAAAHYGEGSGYNDRMTPEMVDLGQPSGLMQGGQPYDMTQPSPAAPVNDVPPNGAVAGLADYFDPLAASGGPQGFEQPVTPPPPDFSSALNTLGAMPDPGIVEAPPQYQFQLPPLVDEHNNATLTQ